jgi:predicted MPP superfamily phosphohydrolase
LSFERGGEGPPPLRAFVTRTDRRRRAPGKLARDPASRLRSAMEFLGRGRHYGWLRPRVERIVLALSFGHWPAKLAWALGWQRRVRRIEHQVTARSWPEGLRPLTFAFGSDFHAGPTTDDRLIDLAFQRMAEAAPDVMLLGGDFVYIDAKFIEPLARAGERTPAPLGKFAVLGNHDLWADYKYVTRRLEDAGVRVLVNQNARLPAPFEHVSVCGIDEYWSGDSDGDQAFAGAAATRVLLIHSPSTLRAVNGHAFDVALCGHTHGGHLALPGERPIWIPQAEINAPYTFGRFDLDGAHTGAALLVSRGVGALEVPFRTYAPPDVLLCTLGPGPRPPA